ncbi:hypothetical protein BDR06DRAFT_1008279 [Suillus hirtellus]|nr:hypothetical protein BDR06DRAFT_1008279 [Suillus hirtellus]
MSSSMPVPVVVAIQAVAFLLKDVETCNVVDAIMKQAAHSITTKLDDDNVADALSRKITDNITARLVDHVVAAISPQVALVHDASQTLNSTIEDAKTLHTSIGRERTKQEDNIKMAADHIEDAVDALYDLVETYQKALQILAPSLDMTQEKIDQLSSQITKVPVQAHGATHLSYSAAAAAYIPPQVDKALGCAALQACQILLDPLPGGTLFLPDTSKHDMAAKIKSALEAAKDDTTPEGTICSIMTLHNGGIIVELETESLAKWLNNQLGRSALENHLDISVSFCQHQYPLVLEKTNSKPTPSPQLDGSNRPQSALQNNVKLSPYSMLPMSKQQMISSAKEYVWKVKDSVPGKTEGNQCDALSARNLITLLRTAPLHRTHVAPAETNIAPQPAIHIIRHTVSTAAVSNTPAGAVHATNSSNAAKNLMTNSQRTECHIS